MDATHDPKRRSFVAGANGHPDFPIQNLPFGVFAPAGGAPRGGVAIGDSILDLAALATSGLLSGEAQRAADAAAGATLNDFLALGAGPRVALRAALSELLAAGSPHAQKLTLHEAARCTLHLPARIGEYTDFYAGLHHATAVGKLFRPDAPLLPNYKHIPIGYHGRASSVVVSGTPVTRPNGQLPSPDGPRFAACGKLDFELELGVWIGPGNPLGTPVPIAQAGAHIAGYCLLNDWSARDIQGWEYVPLGPFLAKNFCTTVSPWIVTPEALAPFRMAQPLRDAGDPAPLPYLFDAADQASGAADILLEVWLETPRAAPKLLARSNAKHLYWTPAQLLAHHASGGCNLQPGDLLGTGTISGPGAGEEGSLLEATLGGKQPVKLASGEERRFLEDGDSVVLRARCERPGYATIGFGPCRGEVRPAP
jgi:fumarylacetoacetase